jgi:ubiquinone/menaquinone biosynthesis C-methylase UbiE
LKIQELIAAVDRIDGINDREWKATLNERKLKELEFHDRDRDKSLQNELAKDPAEFDAMYGNRKYYKTVRRSNAFTQEWMQKNTKGKVFLDYACGNGNNAILAAEAGALLSLGFDISPVSVANARGEAESKNLQNIRFFQADAENTKLPDASIDTILCSGMLHHLDLSYAFPEMRRILKPGGKILAVEALDINPLIKLYRMRTPKMRTAFEAKHILSLNEVKFGERFFELQEIRYWHVVGYVAGKFPKLMKPLEFVDNYLERIPYVQRLAWIFTFELEKRQEDSSQIHL